MRAIKHLIAVGVIALTCSSALRSQTVPPQPFAPVLPSSEGTTTVTPEWLLTRHADAFSMAYSLEWIGNTHRLLYARRGGDIEKPNSVVELLDTDTGARKSLGEGSLPKASPDGSRIAFVRSIVGEGNQLWVMRI